MTFDKEKIATEFHTKFSELKRENIEIINMVGSEIGVSILLKYPNSYLPSISYHDEKLLSMIRIFISEKSFKDFSSLKRIIIEIGFYRQQYASPSEGLSSFIERKPDEKYPIGLNFEDDFFYDVSNSEFYKDDSMIEVEGLINYVLSKHFLPTKCLKGFSTRSRLNLLKLRRGMLKCFFNIFDKLILILFGNTFSVFEDLSYSIKPERINANKPIQGGEQNREATILGIKTTNVWSVTSYSFIHLLFLFIFEYLNLKPDFIKIILKYSLLSIFYVIVTLFLYEKGIQSVLKKLRTYFWKKYEDSYFIQIKI
ncbi:hypothetical protein [Leptospira wolffii]|uniref:hypothetical protein n=1 Tax=Leptospira wolffii TaxID=409998 RepID=UPI0002D73AAB|nr:hypothetical protein [Leptospira wolffii]EPG65614.1 hypothetical protein LEP1GSC061_0101 [Leptospira wolffii serovar Khorat str. Khorat-H2]